MRRNHETYLKYVLGLTMENKHHPRAQGSAVTPSGFIINGRCELERFELYKINSKTNNLVTGPKSFCLLLYAFNIHSW